MSFRVTVLAFDVYGFKLQVHVCIYRPINEPLLPKRIGLDVKLITHCTGCILSNAWPHQLHWGERVMGTAISCTECSQVAGLIQKVSRSSSKAPCLHAAVLHAAVFRLRIVVIIIVTYMLSMHKCMRPHTQKCWRYLRIR